MSFEKNFKTVFQVCTGVWKLYPHSYANNTKVEIFNASFGRYLNFSFLTWQDGYIFVHSKLFDNVQFSNFKMPQVAYSYFINRAINSLL